MEINDLTVYLSLLYGIPFIIIGIIKITNWAVEMIKTRSGHFKVRIISKNSRTITKMLKPKGGGKGNIGQMDIGDKNHPKPVPFTNTPGFVSFEGSTPVVQFDSAGNQLPFVSKANFGGIDKDYFSDLVVMSYNLGNITAKKEDDSVAKKLTLITLLAAAAALFSFLVFQGVNMKMV